MRVKQFLQAISSQMAVAARKLPDNSLIDIYSMLKLTFGQSKESFINNYGEEVLVYDNGLTIINKAPKLIRYEIAMFNVLSQEDMFFIDPSYFVLKKVGFLHRGVLRRYKELFTILQRTEKSIDENSGSLYSDLSGSIDGCQKRVYYINSGNSLQVIADKYAIWITALQGKGIATSGKNGCILRNSCCESKMLPLAKSDYICFRNNRYEDPTPFPVLVENKGKEQLIIYVSYC